MIGDIPAATNTVLTCCFRCGPEGIRTPATALRVLQADHAVFSLSTAEGRRHPLDGGAPSRPESAAQRVVAARDVPARMVKLTVWTSPIPNGYTSLMADGWQTTRGPDAVAFGPFADLHFLRSGGRI